MAPANARTRRSLSATSIAGRLGSRSSPRRGAARQPRSSGSWPGRGRSTRRGHVGRHARAPDGRSGRHVVDHDHGPEPGGAFRQVHEGLGTEVVGEAERVTVPAVGDAPWRRCSVVHVGDGRCAVIGPADRATDPSIASSASSAVGRDALGESRSRPRSQAAPAGRSTRQVQAPRSRSSLGHVLGRGARAAHGCHVQGPRPSRCPGNESGRVRGAVDVRVGPSRDNMSGGSSPFADPRLEADRSEAVGADGEPQPVVVEQDVAPVGRLVEAGRRWPGRVGRRRSPRRRPGRRWG